MMNCFHGCGPAEPGHGVPRVMRPMKSARTGVVPGAGVNWRRMKPVVNSPQVGPERVDEAAGSSGQRPRRLRGAHALHGMRMDVPQMKRRPHASHPRELPVKVHHLTPRPPATSPRQDSRGWRVRYSADSAGQGLGGSHSRGPGTKGHTGEGAEGLPPPSPRSAVRSARGDFKPASAFLSLVSHRILSLSPCSLLQFIFLTWFVEGGEIEEYKQPPAS